MGPFTERKFAVATGIERSENCSNDRDSQRPPKHGVRARKQSQGETWRHRAYQLTTRHR